MAIDHTTQTNPREQGPKPPFAEQPQQRPGVEAAMQPKPYYGETSYVGHGRMTGKAALITGGDSGIGRAVALAFAREGADVLISYLDESEGTDAQETVRAVEQAGRHAVAVAGDITSEAHCAELVERTVKEFGHLDVLVNNAAFQSTHQSIDEFTAQEIERTFRTNVFAPFYLSKAALPRMQAGSTIINTASVEAYKPEPQLMAYAPTKGAVVAFTKALAKEALERGVRVNAVAPGPVWTPLIPSTMPPDKVAHFGEQSPMKRPAQPAELAPTYVFLATPDSSYITGEVIGVTGGVPVS